MGCVLVRDVKITKRDSRTVKTEKTTTDGRCCLVRLVWWIRQPVKTFTRTSLMVFVVVHWYLPGYITPIRNVTFLLSPAVAELNRHNRHNIRYRDSNRHELHRH